MRKPATCGFRSCRFLPSVTRSSFLTFVAPATLPNRSPVDGLNEQVLARTPAGRWGVPEDLAGVAVFLASPASDFVASAAIPVDGGFAAQG